MRREDNLRRSIETSEDVESPVRYWLFGDVIAKLAKLANEDASDFAFTAGRGVDVDKSAREGNGIDGHVLEGLTESSARVRFERPFFRRGI